MQEAPYDADGNPRLNRLAALLSEALARRLGQAQPPAADYSATPLDYPTVVSPNAIAKFAVSTEYDL